jgi:(p)ppGpp synthase/HD superfamily hydrolase
MKTDNAKLLSTAIALVAKAFHTKLDKGGQPYILHCLHVMNQMPKDDHELMMIAVMHDLIEDTDFTLEGVIELGFPPRVVDALRLLTHDPATSYDAYISILAFNRDCVLVKRADLRHNSDIMRMKGLRQKDFLRLEKYHRAFEYLKD